MGVEDVLLTSSGRGGLYMIFRFLPQKKVYLPDYTCMVVVECAMLAGKEVHYVSTSASTFNANEFGEVDEDSIIVATHQYGLPCEIEKIVEQSHKKGAVVVEDCAAAFGSCVNGKLVGTFGDYAAFSFDPSKLINVPNKAGFIIAKNVNDLLEIEKATPVITKDLSYKLKSLMNGFIYCILKNTIIYRTFHYLTIERKGKMQISEHDVPIIKLLPLYTHGFSEWQSVFVNKQMDNIGMIIEKRKALFKLYHLKLSNPLILKPIYNQEAVCIRYTIRVDDKVSFYNKCLAEGVDMGFSFSHIGTPKDNKGAQKIASEILNIPYYYQLSDKEAQRVIDVINRLN